MFNANYYAADMSNNLRNIVKSSSADSVYTPTLSQFRNTACREQKNNRYFQVQIIPVFTFSYCMMSHKKLIIIHLTYYVFHRFQFVETNLSFDNLFL